MSICAKMWHYPPELPKNGEKIIWVSALYGKYNSGVGVWNHRDNGGKNTGSTIIKWAYLKDVMLQDVYSEWMSMNGLDVPKKPKPMCVAYLGDGRILLDGVEYMEVRRYQNG